MPDVAGRLNEQYLKALRKRKFVWKDRRVEQWGMTHLNAELTSRDTGVLCSYSKGRYNRGRYLNNLSTCCGVGQIEFQTLSFRQIASWVTDEDRRQIVAKIIQVQLNKRDDRVYLIGLPVQKRSGRPEPYYAPLRKVLLEFGATELNAEPYKNANTGNRIAVFALRKPDADV